MEYDLLNIPFEQEFKTHKLRRTIPAPNSYFINLICKKCDTIKRCFSHGQSKVECIKCNQVLAIPTGGKLSIKYEVAISKVLNSSHKKIEKKEKRAEHQEKKEENKQAKKK